MSNEANILGMSRKGWKGAIVFLRPRPAAPSPPTRPVWAPVRGWPAAAVGQVWRKIEGVPTLWEVVGVVEDLLGLPHVRLRLKADPTTTKLIAARRLQDARVYRLVRTDVAD